MVSRSRESRRRPQRPPAIWHGNLARAVRNQRPSVQHGVREHDMVGWRLVSGFIILGLVAVLFVLFSANVFYVHAIGVGGLRYLTKEEVFALTDIANMHIFWVDPQQVRENILRSPSIADAEVRVGWPPQMVEIVIEERQPALTWEQSGASTWIDLQGRVMLLREDRADLLRITAEPGADDGPLGPNVQLDVDIVTGALQLRTLYPNITHLRYHPEKGLGYNDGRGWEVWFGIGTDMPEKLVVYNALVENLLGRGIQPAEVNVANPHAPFYALPGGL